MLTSWEVENESFCGFYIFGALWFGDFGATIDFDLVSWLRCLRNSDGFGKIYVDTWGSQFECYRVFILHYSYSLNKFSFIFTLRSILPRFICYSLSILFSHSFYISQPLSFNINLPWTPEKRAHFPLLSPNFHISPKNRWSQLLP